MEPDALFWALVLGFVAGHYRTLEEFRQEYIDTFGGTLSYASFHGWFTEALCTFHREVLKEALEDREIWQRFWMQSEYSRDTRHFVQDFHQPSIRLIEILSEGVNRDDDPVFLSERVRSTTLKEDDDMLEVLEEAGIHSFCDPLYQMSSLTDDAIESALRFDDTDEVCPRCGAAIESGHPLGSNNIEVQLCGHVFDLQDDELGSLASGS